ncbi:MAG: hypothetical protein WCI18_10065 [Pseudomonadota bacterium]
MNQISILSFSLLLGSVSCAPGRYKSDSEGKDLTNIASLQADGTGTFVVTCKDGHIERSVTSEAIKEENVCISIAKPTPGPTPTGPLTQVNPMAFNAFNIWREGQGAEILDYPELYGSLEGTIAPDGVFYVAPSEFVKKVGNLETFIGVPTEGAKVEGDVLEYPVRGSKQLWLKFTSYNIKVIDQLYAVETCKERGLRLPTIRETFDFCAAGVTKPNYGPNFQPKYPIDGRCAKTSPRSASVFSDNRSGAWIFSGIDGNVFFYPRKLKGGLLWCVGAPLPN